MEKNILFRRLFLYNFIALKIAIIEPVLSDAPGESLRWV